jgi:hypothetical protein
MSDSTELERRYRRLLLWYPRAFRLEKEQEILSVLMAGAADGQRRPSGGEVIDLIVNGISMRLRTGPVPQRTIFWTVRLMYGCTIVRLVDIPLPGAGRAAHRNLLDVGISWGVLALLAWAYSRGYKFPRLIFALWGPIEFLVSLYSGPSGLAWSRSFALAQFMVLLVQSAVVALIITRQSAAHQHTPE